MLMMVLLLLLLVMLQMLVMGCRPSTANKGAKASAL